jgi:hypothetical protein
MVEFRDDPKYDDDDVLPLTKSVGWMPTKDVFNIAWNHRAVVQQILRNPTASLTPEQEATLEQMLKQFDAQIKRTAGD